LRHKGIRSRRTCIIEVQVFHQRGGNALARKTDNLARPVQVMSQHPRHVVIGKLLSVDRQLRRFASEAPTDQSAIRRDLGNIFSGVDGGLKQQQIRRC